jgi:hypothetical protein
VTGLTFVWGEFPGETRTAARSRQRKCRTSGYFTEYLLSDIESFEVTHYRTRMSVILLHKVDIFRQLVPANSPLPGGTRPARPVARG